MIIAVISDTHRQNNCILKAIKEANKENADAIIHLGDNVADVKLIEQYFKGQIIFIKGNCDFDTNVECEKVINFNGTKIFITHGHNYNVKYSLLNIKFRAMELGAKIALYGHSHVAMIEKDTNLILMNPGSTSLPRSKNKSMGFIKIDENNKIECVIRNLD